MDALEQAELKEILDYTLRLHGYTYEETELKEIVPNKYTYVLAMK